MIPRYTRTEMGNIWSDDNKYKIWLEIEVLAVEAQAELGLINKNTAAEIRLKAKFDINRIIEIEEITKHDIIAFLTNVEEYVGESSRYIHLGMTSSDVLDTCLAIQCRDSGFLILNQLQKLKGVLERRAKEFKYTVCIGRSHGIHAEPTTFGLKFALWLDECNRNITRLQNSINEISYGKINGAVGTYEHLSPKIQEYVCKNLGLQSAPITTQVISRDRHASYLYCLALIASFLEKIATEIRHLQRTEVQEAEEFFSAGQKGSSAMPHKRNPIISENICGQARLIRSNTIAAIENNALWHERDISHSSVERIIFPDSTISLDYILNKTINLLDKLVVYPQKMIENLNLTNGVIYSQKVLLALASKGLKRQEAYKIVQQCAMISFNKKIPFFESLKDSPEIMKHFTENELNVLFSYDNIFKNVDFIFDSVGIE